MIVHLITGDALPLAGFGVAWLGLSFAKAKHATSRHTPTKRGSCLINRSRADLDWQLRAVLRAAGLLVHPYALPALTGLMGTSSYRAAPQQYAPETQFLQPNKQPLVSFVNYIQRASVATASAALSTTAKRRDLWLHRIVEFSAPKPRSFTSMKCVGLVLLAAASLAAAQHDYDPTECSVSFGNSTFNLNDYRGLDLADIEDADAGTAQDWYYNVAVCSNVIPSEQYKCGRSGLAGGYQISKKTGICHALSGDVRDASNVEWFLLNPRDPAMGVSLQYTGGAQCSGVDAHGKAFTKARSMRLDFICDGKRQGVPQQNITVVETDTCEYSMVFHTSLGCPLECPEVKQQLGSNQLCGAHGVCDFNTASGQSACFCNEGWSGTDCTKAGGKGEEKLPKANHAGAVVGMLFGFTALGAGLAYAGVFWYNKKYGGGGSASAGGASADSYAQLDGDGGAMFSGSSDAGGDNSGYVAPQA